MMELAPAVPLAPMERRVMTETTPQAPHGKTAMPETVPQAVEARRADFAELPDPASVPGRASLDHLLDVTCNVTVELGRCRLSIAEVLKLDVGSVVELDRLVSEPVDILVQGVLLARGEVVVVDDRFAVRIKEIVNPRKK